MTRRSPTSAPKPRPPAAAPTARRRARVDVLAPRAGDGPREHVEDVLTPRAGDDTGGRS